MESNKKHNILRDMVNKIAEDNVSVYLIRHGATDFNSPVGKDDRIRGWLDVKLNKQGKEEAKQDGEYLKKEKISKIYSSDLSRTKETSEILNKNFNVPIIYTKSLRPWNLGIYQGQSSEKVHKELEQYVKDPNKKVEGGESFNTFLNRYLGEMRKILDEAKKTKKEYFIVTHYRNLKVAQAWKKFGSKDQSLDDATLFSNNLDTGAVICCDWDSKNNQWKLKKLKI